MTDTRKVEIANLFADALENEEFKAAATNIKSVAEFCELLNANGIDATIEEVEQMSAEGMEQLPLLYDVATGELTEMGLDMVAGGGKVAAAVTYLGGLVFTGAVAFCLGAAGAAATPLIGLTFCVSILTVAALRS